MNRNGENLGWLWRTGKSLGRSIGVHAEKISKLQENTLTPGFLSGMSEEGAAILNMGGKH